MKRITVVGMVAILGCTADAGGDSSGDTDTFYRAWREEPDLLPWIYSQRR